MQTREQWEIKSLSGKEIWTGVGKDLREANLRGADLSGADPRGYGWCEAWLDEALPIARAALGETK